MIGSIIGSAVGAAGSIFGGISAAKAAKRAKQSLEAEKKENEAWYDRRYNEDYTQRADAQAALSELDRRYRERAAQAAGTQAVMGGTDESVAAQKAANAQGLAEAISDIAVAGNAKKDQIESQYQTRNAALNDSLRQVELGKAQAISQAIGGVASAASTFGEGLDDYLALGKKGGSN